MFWVISVYFNVRNILLKSGTFPPGTSCILATVPIILYFEMYSSYVPLGPAVGNRSVINSNTRRNARARTHTHTHTLYNPKFRETCQRTMETRQDEVYYSATVGFILLPHKYYNISKDWKDDSLSPRQDFVVFRENLEVLYHVHNSPLFYPTMSHMNPIHINILYSYTNLNFTFPFIRKPAMQALPFSFSSSLPLMLHCQSISSSLIWAPLQCLTNSTHYEVPQHSISSFLLRCSPQFHTALSTL